MNLNHSTAVSTQDTMRILAMQILRSHLITAAYLLSSQDLRAAVESIVKEVLSSTSQDKRRQRREVRLSVGIGIHDDSHGEGNDRPDKVKWKGSYDSKADLIRCSISNNNNGLPATPQKNLEKKNTFNSGRSSINVPKVSTLGNMKEANHHIRIGINNITDVRKKKSCDYENNPEKAKQELSVKQVPKFMEPANSKENLLDRCTQRLLKSRSSNHIFHMGHIEKPTDFDKLEEAENAQKKRSKRAQQAHFLSEVFTTAPNKLIIPSGATFSGKIASRKSKSPPDLKRGAQRQKEGSQIGPAFALSPSQTQTNPPTTISSQRNSKTSLIPKKKLSPRFTDNPLSKLLTPPDSLQPTHHSPYNHRADNSPQHKSKPSNLALSPIANVLESPSLSNLSIDPSPAYSLDNPPTTMPAHTLTNIADYGLD